MADPPPHKPGILFVNRFYWPDERATAQLLADLAEALAARGHSVGVVASHSGILAAPHAELREGVRIRRVRCTHLGHRNLPGRALDFATFAIGALWRMARGLHSGDAVVVLTDPPLLGILAWPLARLRGARIFHWVQDIYPELAIELAGHRWLGALRPLRNLAWRRADGCVTLGSDMAARIARCGVPVGSITIAPNWSPKGLAPQNRESARELRATWNLGGKFVVAYSGNLGRVHDLHPVLDIAANLLDAPGIGLVLVGNGAQREGLEAAAAARGLDNVQFHPPQPRIRLAASLALGDIHLVTLLPGCEQLVFPSKLYGIAAVGRPVLFIGPRDCEVARIVEGRGFGRAFTRDETAKAAQFIRQVAAEPASLGRYEAAAIQFSLGHRGPDDAAGTWERLLAPRMSPQS